MPSSGKSSSVAAHDRLRTERAAAAAHVHVVAVEGDVDRADVDAATPRALGDEPPQPRWRAGRRACGCRRARRASRSALRSMISCAMRERVRSHRLGVEQDLGRRRGRGDALSPRSFPASLDRVKGSVSNRVLRRIACRRTCQAGQRWPTATSRSSRVTTRSGSSRSARAVPSSSSSGRQEVEGRDVAAADPCEGLVAARSSGRPSAAVTRSAESRPLPARACIVLRRRESGLVDLPDRGEVRVQPVRREVLRVEGADRDPPVAPARPGAPRRAPTGGRARWMTSDITTRSNHPSRNGSGSASPWRTPTPVGNRLPGDRDHLAARRRGPRPSPGPRPARAAASRPVPQPTSSTRRPRRSPSSTSAANASHQAASVGRSVS